MANTDHPPFANREQMILSYANWFVQDLKIVFFNCVSRAASVAKKNPKISVIMMQARGPLGQWFEENYIYNKGYSVTGLIELLNPPRSKIHEYKNIEKQKREIFDKNKEIALKKAIQQYGKDSEEVKKVEAMQPEKTLPFFELPPHPGNRQMKADDGYSGTQVLFRLIEAMVIIFKEHGLKEQSRQLEYNFDLYKSKIDKILEEAQAENDAYNAEEEEEPDEPKVDPNLQVRGIIETALKNDVPEKFKHEIRIELQRTGFTLPNFMKILTKLGIKI